MSPDGGVERRDAGAMGCEDGWPNTVLDVRVRPPPEQIAQMRSPEHAGRQTGKTEDSIQYSGVRSQEKRGRFQEQGSRGKVEETTSEERGAKKHTGGQESAVSDRKGGPPEKPAGPPIN
jgi:hypothetical protein